MASDFLLVVTPDWIEMPIQFIDAVLALGEESYVGMIQREAWGELNEYVEIAGLRPDGQDLKCMRMLSIGNGPDPYTRIRVWCQFGPIVYT